MCEICRDHLFSETNVPSLKLKNRGSYKIPSLDVIKICKQSEMVFREHTNIIFTKKKYKRYFNSENSANS